MAIVDAYDAVLLDLDGVLYRGDAPVPGAAETVAALRARGIGIAFVTNNASRTPTQVAAHLVSVGIPATAEEVETSALVAARILAERGVRRVFPIGQDGILEALAGEGLVAVGVADAPEAVVVSLDRGLTYDRLRDGALCVQRGAALVGTNPDTTFPAEDGLWPGAGAILAALAAATGTTPEILGKPAPDIYRSALRRSGGTRPIVVGDRLDTDIAGAVVLGWDSLLVLTGVTRSGDAAASEPRPTFVRDDVAGLLRD
ncbi:MAG: HAD-IIA family hydrolase [Actinomycetota bacterium]